MKKLAIVLLASFVIVACESKRVSENASPTNSNTTANNSIGLLPEIAEFLADHKEFGEAIRTEAMPDWAKGKRQRVIFDSRRNLLFYIKENKVVTVYEDSSDGRKIVWGATE